MKESLRVEEANILQMIWRGLPKAVLANGNPGPEVKPAPQIDWDTESGGIPFHYICNPTGTFRWVFPAQQRYPVHLSLYNSAHWKAKAYKLATHFAFRLGQPKRLLSGTLNISGWEDTCLASMLATVPHDGYAIFTGTVGENRKAIVAINQGSRTTHYLKIPLTEASRINVSNEAQTLKQLAGLSLKHLWIPAATHLPNEAAVLLTNACPQNGREGNKLEVKHISALKELYAATSRKAYLGELPFYKEISQQINRIKQLDFVDSSLDAQQIKRIASALQREFQRLDPDEHLPVTWAHGDFTSWNMYLSPAGLHVYDWELARPDMPVFYDAFHYIYQTGVLLRHQSYAQIERELLRAQRLPGTQQLFKHYQLSFAEQHRRYLLHLVSYYLRIYMDEPQLHMQVHWLLKVWDQALNRFSS